MKITKPSLEIIEQDTSSGIEGVLQHIERIGRVCYKSEEKITDNSYKKFVAMLENKGHGAMLEHGTVYLKIPKCSNNIIKNILWHNHYTVIRYYNDIKHVTTNYRFLYENDLIDCVLPFISCLTKDHERRISVKFICDRGVSHEFVRNRGKYGNAFAQESTRYCNYNNGDGVVFCEPVWIEPNERQEFEEACRISEAWYEHSSKKWNWKPQQARGFLNHFLKTELIITAMMSDWVHFFSLRADFNAHPSAQQLAYPLKEEFIRRGWING